MKIFKNNSKNGMITAELAITIALGVLVTLVAIGLFSQHLNAMSTSSNFTNMFNNNDEKTAYSQFNRDYIDSQINVQIMGEQGLEMLRQRANNKILDIISENPSGRDSNTVGYLVTIINAIVGHPDICVYMKKESKKTCDDKDADIGGYSYSTDVSAVASGVIVLIKVDPEGAPVKPITNFIFNVSREEISAILGTSSSKAAALGKSDTVKTEEKFQFIKELTRNIKSYVNSDALLINPYDTVESNYTKMSIQEEKFYLVALLSKLKESISEAHSSCTTYGNLTGIDYNYSNKNTAIGCSSNQFKNDSENVSDFVGKNELNEFIKWADQRIAQINSYNGSDNKALVNIVVADPNLKQMVNILNNDMVAKTENGADRELSCQVFNNGMNSIKSSLGVSAAIPEYNCQTN